MNSVLLTHMAAVWFMVGLIWMVQIVHYPLFRQVSSGSFPEYESGHARRIGRLLIVPASLEVITAGWLAVSPPPGVSVPLVMVAGLLLFAIWVMTAIVQVPLHRRLSTGFDQRIIDRLLNTNWVRTGLWTTRGALVSLMLAQALT